MTQTLTDAGQAPAKRRISGRWQLVLLALVCVAPVIASYYSYYVLRPQGRTNFGTLIEPQRPLPAVAATDTDGRAVELTSLKGQWLLLSVAGGACDARCEENLYLQHQLRASLGKSKDRFDWVWLVDDDEPVRAELASALQGAVVLRLPAAQLAAWLQPEAGHRLADHLYVVDPMGNWMMRFPPLDKESAKQARSDLVVLQRASVGWDRPGRHAHP